MPDYDPETDTSTDGVFDHPAFCRLEYWNPVKQEWEHAHAGISLLHPRRYVERLVPKGKQGRVTILDGDLQPIHVLTGPPVAKYPTCSYCGDDHPEPHDGACLL